MRKSAIRLTALLAGLGMFAAACAASDGGVDVGVVEAGRADAATAPTEKFGDLASPCGAGDASGATDKGVTDSTIAIGYGDDAGYAGSPGLNKEIGDAVKTMIEWCNAQGGINGRTVVGTYYDAKILEVNAAVTKACTDKVFMLVGQGWALDASQEEARIACKLATVPAFSVSNAFAHGAGMVQSLPNPGDQTPLSFAYQIAAKFPDAIKKTAFVYANYSSTIESKSKIAAAFPSVGYSFLGCDQMYNLGGEPDWKPLASALKACGAEIVYWVGSPAPNFENLLAASKAVGFAPKAFMTDGNNYDPTFAAWNGRNGGVADNVYIRMAVVPFEEADKNPATKKYLDLLAASGGKTGLLGVQATGSFLLWAMGVRACGSTVTAACVLREIDKLQDWTAGGLHVATQPAQNEAPYCGVMMKLQGATFERVAPVDKTFECDPKFRAANLTTEFVAAARLDSGRTATQYGSFTP